MKKLLVPIILILSAPFLMGQGFPPPLQYDGSAFRNGSQVYYPTFKFGLNGDIDQNSDPEVIHSQSTASAAYGYLSAADTLHVVSAASADTIGGTGARTVVIEGLDGNYNKISVTATLRGATPDTVTTTFLRVYRAYIASTGTGQTNAGAITITDNEDSPTTLAVIPLGYGQTQMAQYTTRAGHQAYLTSWQVCTEKNQPATDATFRIRARNAVNGGWRVLDEVSIDTAINPCYERIFRAPVTVGEKNDIELVVQLTGADNLLVHGNFELWEVK